MKKEINNLRVVCENRDSGCEWKGLFKTLIVSSLVSFQQMTLYISTVTGSTLVKLSVHHSGV